MALFKRLELMEVTEIVRRWGISSYNDVRKKKRLLGPYLCKNEFSLEGLDLYDASHHWAAPQRKGRDKEQDLHKAKA